MRGTSQAWGAPGMGRARHEPAGVPSRLLRESFLASRGTAFGSLHLTINVYLRVYHYGSKICAAQLGHTD